MRKMKEICQYSYLQPTIWVWFDSFYLHVSTKTAILYIGVLSQIKSDERTTVHSAWSSLVVTKYTSLTEVDVPNFGERTIQLALHGRHRKPFKTK